MKTAIHWPSVARALTEIERTGVRISAEITRQLMDRHRMGEGDDTLTAHVRVLDE